MCYVREIWILRNRLNKLFWIRNCSRRIILFLRYEIGLNNIVFSILFLKNLFIRFNTMIFLCYRLYSCKNCWMLDILCLCWDLLVWVRVKCGEF